MAQRPVRMGLAPEPSPVGLFVGLVLLVVAVAAVAVGWFRYAPEAPTDPRSTAAVAEQLAAFGEVDFRGLRAGARLADAADRLGPVLSVEGGRASALLPLGPTEIWKVLAVVGDGEDPVLREVAGWREVGDAATAAVVLDALVAAHPRPPDARVDEVPGEHPQPPTLQPIPLDAWALWRDPGHTLVAGRIGAEVVVIDTVGQ